MLPIPRHRFISIVLLLVALLSLLVHALPPTAHPDVDAALARLEALPLAEFFEAS